MTKTEALSQWAKIGRSLARRSIGFPYEIAMKDKSAIVWDVRIRSETPVAIITRVGGKIQTTNPDVPVHRVSPLLGHPGKYKASLKYYPAVKKIVEVVPIAGGVVGKIEDDEEFYSIDNFDFWGLAENGKRK